MKSSMKKQPNLSRSVHLSRLRAFVSAAPVLGTLLGTSIVACPSVARADVPERIVHSVTGSPGANEYSPNPGLLLATDGNFYGTTAGNGSVNGSVFKLSGDGSTYDTIMPFTGGEAVHSGVTEGPDGNLYGTIKSGQGSIANGGVFKLSKAGKFEMLHAFAVADVANGANPDGPVVVGAEGNVYGTTYYGGADGATGSGTIFKLEPAGTFTTLYDFGIDDGAVSGAHPRSRLVQDANGNLYGTTTTGGQYKGGTVFRVTPAGQFNVVASFGGTSGSGPHDLLLACDGNLYGRAFGGNGIIFEVTPSGSLSTVHGLVGTDGDVDLNPGDGDASGGTLIEGRNHKLYGTAQYGGATTGNNRGTVYELALDGTFTVLYNFKGTATDGGQPMGTAVGNDGNLYGTFRGGIGGLIGGLYQLTLPAGSQTPVPCPSGPGTSTDAGAGDGGTADAGGGTDVNTGDTSNADANTADSGSSGTGGSGTTTADSGGSDTGDPGNAGGVAGAGGSGGASSGAGGASGNAAGGSDTGGGSAGKSKGCAVTTGAPAAGSSVAIVVLLGLGWAARRRRTLR